MLKFVLPVASLAVLAAPANATVIFDSLSLQVSAQNTATGQSPPLTFDGTDTTTIPSTPLVATTSSTMLFLSGQSSAAAAATFTFAGPSVGSFTLGPLSAAATVTAGSTSKMQTGAGADGQFIYIFSIDAPSTITFNYVLPSLSLTDAYREYSIYVDDPDGHPENYFPTTDQGSFAVSLAKAGTYEIGAFGGLFVQRDGTGANAAITPAGTINFAISAVPEAASWAMMLLGFGGMGFAMRRQRQKNMRIRFSWRTVPSDCS